MKEDFIIDLVSIVTPVYNAERFIQETVDSVLAQTYTEFELILVDDCSSDDSVAIIEQNQQNDNRIKLVQLKENSGAAVARNAGIAAAQGQYIAFIDSDDRWTENKLTKQLGFMKKNDVSFSYTNFALVNEEGAIIKEQVDLPMTLDYDGLLKNTAIACSTVVIDRHAIGDFRMPLVRKGQDTATWLMLMRERKAAAFGLNEVLNYYRQVEGSISSDRFGALKRTWHTYRNIERLPLLKCVYYFSFYVFNAIKRRV